MNETERAYIAGLFDGEGCIWMGKTKPTVKNTQVNVTYSLRVEICNTDLSVLNWLVSILGGKVRYRNMTTANRPLYGWSPSRNCTCRFLFYVMPYLHIKKKQAETALKYKNWMASLMRAPRRPYSKGKPYSKEIMDKKEFFRNYISELNHGIIKVA